MISEKGYQIINWISEALSPPTLLDPCKWAEENIVLTTRTGTARAGRYSSDVTPHVREVMSEFINPKTRMITLCFSAQSGKTQTELNLLAYVIDNAPAPTMFVAPTQDFARSSISEKRLQPLIEDNPILCKHKLANADKFKLLDISLDNMDIYLRWAGSPTAVSSVAIKYMFNDEVDKWKGATENEADPLFLARERTKTFADHKVVNSSTPTTDDGNITKLLKKGDHRRYNVPCPLCKATFVIEWSMIKWTDNKNASDEEIHKSTYLECPHCKGQILEKYKRNMVNSGFWVKTNPNPDFGHASFQISELYSLFTKWGDLAVKFIHAQKASKIGDFTELQNFVNSSLAETWKQPVSSVKNSAEVMRLVDSTLNAGVVPSGVRMITAGCDTQDNGFYFVIRAWGADYESWKIRHGFVPSLDALAKILFQDKYLDSEGMSYHVGWSFIDAMGHRTSEIYDFCKTHGRINPTKGEQTMSTTYKHTHIDFYPGTDKPIQGGVELIRLHTKYWKDLLVSKMAINPTDAGAFHLNNSITDNDDYIKQMTAEYRDMKGNWICPNHRANHFFDCEVNAIACAYYSGVEFMDLFYPNPVDKVNNEKKVEKLKNGIQFKRKLW